MAIALPDPGALFAAAVIAFEEDSTAHVDAVLAAGWRSATLFRGVESALGWVDLARVRRRVDDFLRSSHPELRRAAIAAFAVHRIDPGPALREAVLSSEAALRARAVKAVWQLARRDLLPVAREVSTGADVACRFSAAWGGALLARDAEAIADLRRFAETGERYPDRAVQLAGLLLRADEGRAWQRSLDARLAILGTWALADPADVPWLVAQMGHRSTARVSAEAFETITGVDLERAGLAAAPSDDDPADPDAGLPWPDAAAVEAWWARHGDRFPCGVRHVAGQPAGDGSLRAVLRDGRVRQRAFAATELALRTGTAPFEVRAPAPRQRSADGS